MANLEQFVRGIMENGVDAKTPHRDEIMNLTATINDEQDNIGVQFAAIGERYYALVGDSSEGELGALCKGVKASEQKIHDSKMKIGELMGRTFCEECGEEVDDDALFCNNCGAKMPVKLMPGMVLCRHCGKPVKESFRFCSYCGMSMAEEPAPAPAPKAEPAPEKKASKEKKCPHCGFTTTDPDKMFCDECGQRLLGGEPKKKEKKAEKKPTHKVCPHCGFKVFDAETMFCDDCGTRLVEEEK